MRRWQFDHHILGYLYVFIISIHFLSDIYLKASVQEVQEAIGLKLWIAAFYFIFLALYFLIMNRFITPRKYITLKKKLAKSSWLIGCFSLLGSGALSSLLKKYQLISETPWIDLVLVVNIVAMNLLGQLLKRQQKAFFKTLLLWMLNNTLLLLFFYQLAIFFNMGTNSMLEMVVIMVTMLISFAWMRWSLGDLKT